mgnify:CR=1 FL=1
MNFDIDGKKQALIELCDLLSIKKNMLHKYLYDTLKAKRYNLNPDKLQALSKYFECSIDELLNKAEGE